MADRPIESIPPQVLLALGRAGQKAGKKHLDLAMVRRGKAMEAEAQAKIKASSHKSR